MSADVLRQAAALMRSRAEAAVCSCGGPACTIEHAGVREGEMAARFDDWTRVVDHYVGMTPAVALAVADWLDCYAAVIDRDHPIAFQIEALAVARAYLGDDCDAAGVDS